MKLDDQICCCFHVSLRKLVNFARRECPTRPSQLSECLNAGTGCGWCIPILKKIHARVESGAAWDEGETVAGLPETAQEYAQARKEYLKSDDKNTFS